MARRVYVRVTISLDKPDVKELDRLAAQRGLARSAYIRMVLIEYLAKKGPANSN